MKYKNPEPSNQNLVLSIPLNNGFTAGDILHDESGNGNTGTAVNAPVPSYPGFLFNGSDQHIDCGEDASLDITTLSITAWVKLATGYSTTGYVIGKGTFADPGFFFGVDSSKRVGLDGGSSNLVNGAEVLLEDIWTFIGASFSGTVGKIYVNDSAVETETITAPASQATINLLIGVKNFISEVLFVDFFDGHIADVRIYNAILTDAQFKSIYYLQRHKYNALS